MLIYARKKDFMISAIDIFLGKIFENEMKYKSPPSEEYLKDADFEYSNNRMKH